MGKGDFVSRLAAPTAEEFEAARRREVARLNLRLSEITGYPHHTPEERELLGTDTAERKLSDVDTVRRWTAREAAESSEASGGGSPA